MWFLWPPLFCIQVGFILWNFFHSWALPICLKVMESNSYDQMTRCQSSTIQYNILWPKWNITVSIIVPLMVDSYKPTWNAMWAVECIGLVNGLIGNNIKLGRDLMWYTIFFFSFYHLCQLSHSCITYGKQVSSGFIQNTLLADIPLLPSKVPHISGLNTPSCLHLMSTSVILSQLHYFFTYYVINTPFDWVFLQVRKSENNHKYKFRFY